MIPVLNTLTAQAMVEKRLRLEALERRVQAERMAALKDDLEVYRQSSIDAFKTFKAGEAGE